MSAPLSVMWVLELVSERLQDHGYARSLPRLRALGEEIASFGPARVTAAAIDEWTSRLEGAADAAEDRHDADDAALYRHCAEQLSDAYDVQIRHERREGKAA